MLKCEVVIRETPPSPPVPSDQTDPAHRTVFAEPVLAADNIQGMILTGFNKSHRILLFANVTPPEDDYSGFKKWLKEQTNFIATASEVLAFSRLFKSTRERRGREGTVKSTWLSISFSFDFLSKLNEDADEFVDKAFQEGLAERSADLGDPTDGIHAPKNWLVGGPDNEADMLLVIEADDRADMLDELFRVQDSFDGMIDKDGLLVKTGIEVIFTDEGSNLPAPLSGHEHFGFLDGVSQPGLRGLLSKNPNDVFTLRQNPNKRDRPEDPNQPASPTNKISPAQGKPGQDLLYPGEFIFGYPKQIKKEDPNADGLNPNPGPNSLTGPFEDGSKKPAGPAWAKDGSLLVFRRLRQDVGGFHRFLHDTAQANKVTDPPNASSARLVGSKLVGRWPSGAPVERTPGAENFALGNDDCKNNNFEFQGNSDAVIPGPGDPFACKDNDPAFPLARADADGSRCPFSGHIRKAYPRDDEGLNGVPPKPDPALSEAATQTHRLLRRGLPYGPVSSSSPDAPVDDDVDRGLQFLCYQTSIENQFEFVIKNWVNAAGFKEALNKTPNGTPIDQGGGHDPIIGQNSEKGRKRTFTLTIPDPADPDNAAKVKSVQLTTDKEWVFPTGGGYFFTPSIDALLNHLS